MPEPSRYILGFLKINSAERSISFWETMTIIVVPSLAGEPRSRNFVFAPIGCTGCRGCQTY
jgi:hypothetical protein